MSGCPCQSGRAYQACCQPFIERGELPSHPEALMRSRYTAYSQANIDYIKQTMRGPASKHFDEKAAKQWASSVSWQGLTVLKVDYQLGTKVGYVEFTAYYLENGKPKQLHENSRFEYDQGRWYYISC